MAFNLLSEGILNFVLPSDSEGSDDEIINMLLEDSDSEEELILGELMRTACDRRNCIKNYLSDVVPTYFEEKFKRHFRISISLFESLSKKFEKSEEYKSMRSGKSLSPKTDLAVFLWFDGHEACSFRDIGGRFDLCIASVSRIIHRTTMFLSKMAPSLIVWPSEKTKQRSSNFFGTKCGFNKAIGRIDGTRIIIDLPKERKDDYIDRKGNVSLCGHGICNVKKKFINVFLGHPGSCHDSWVLQNSAIYNKLGSACGDYYLLGDSAYPCPEHLITPFRDNGHLTNAQKSFNIKLSSGHVAIELTFGILKMRFKQPYYCKLRGIEKLCHFIMACCVLHNIANDDDLEFDTEDSIDYSDDVQLRKSSLRTNAIRDSILQQMNI